MLEQIIQLVTILFLLSMVCERIADFLKHYLCGNEFFGIGDTITKSPGDDIKEQARAYRILKINVWCGVLVSAILKADLIKIFNNIKDPGKTIGWNNINSYNTLDSFLLIPGIFLTGCFISFGSKFWHDLLDILYQVKNAKRVLADPQTYKIDNINTLQKVFNTYQSEFIKAAYLEAKTKYMAMENVKAIGIKNNDLGYYFEITVSKNDTSINQSYQYLLDDGTPQNIPIKIVVLSNNDRIIAHNVDLSGKIFDMANPDNWGTLGVIVKPLDENSSKRYLLTCCHNVVNPIKNIPTSNGGTDLIKGGTVNNGSNFELGKVTQAERDHEIDAALIEIDPSKISAIINSVPKMGAPQKPRQLFNKDAGNVKVFIYGAKSGNESNTTSKGVVTSIYNEIKVTYNSNEEFTIVNTIAVSNNNTAISQAGDSGACVLDSKNDVIGLVVAGSSEVTYLLPINTLLSKLNVQLV